MATTDMSPVRTLHEFLESMEQLVQTTAEDSTRTLEEYLRALWALVQARREEHVTWALIGELLRDAFEQEPALFDEEWLRIAPPCYDCSWIDDWGQMRHVLLFQIADRHRLAPLHFTPAQLYFGVDSPSGQRWYNHYPEDYLEAAWAGLSAKAELAKETGSSPVISNINSPERTWADLALILEFGQSYE